MPRGLSRAQCALYLAISAGTFDSLVADGTMPAPIRFGRRRVWDRGAIDSAVDRLSNAPRAADPLDSWGDYE